MLNVDPFPFPLRPDLASSLMMKSSNVFPEISVKFTIDVPHVASLGWSEKSLNSELVDPPGVDGFVSSVVSLSVSVFVSVSVFPVLTPVPELDPLPPPELELDEDQPPPPQPQPPPHLEDHPPPVPPHC